MGRHGEHEVIAYGAVWIEDPAHFFAALERTQKTRHWRGGMVLDVYGVRGVAVRRFEVLLPRREPERALQADCACEISTYAGKVTLALVPRDDLAPGQQRWLEKKIEYGERVFVRPLERSGDTCVFSVADQSPRGSDDSVTRTWKFQLHDARFDSAKDARGMAVYVWSRWYRHLGYEDVSPYIESGFDSLFEAYPPTTKADAMRMISREFYRLSRELGWSKVTRKMRDRWHVPPGPQWVRTELVDVWRRVFHASVGADGQTIGDYTLWAAHWRPNYDRW